MCCVLLFSTWITNHSNTQNRTWENRRKRKIPAIQKYFEGLETEDENQPKEMLRVTVKDSVVLLPSKSISEMHSSLVRHDY